MGKEGGIFCGTVKLQMSIRGCVMSGIEKSDVEEAILRALDKGIDDMENGRVVPHEYAMEIARQRLKECVLRPKSEQEIWEELAESRACYERGEYMDFDEVLDMISKKYEL